MLTFSMRLEGETEDHLNDLSTLFRLSKAETIRKCINTVWADLNKDHPEVKAALEKINSLADFMKSLDNQ